MKSSKIVVSCLLAACLAGECPTPLFTTCVPYEDAECKIPEELPDGDPVEAHKRYA